MSDKRQNVKKKKEKLKKEKSNERQNVKEKKEKLKKEESDERQNVKEKLKKEENDERQNVKEKLKKEESDERQNVKEKKEKLKKEESDLMAVLKKLNDAIYSLEDYLSYKFWLSKIYILQMSWEITYWKDMAMRYEILSQILPDKVKNVSFLRWELSLKRDHISKLNTVILSKDIQNVDEKHYELLKCLKFNNKENEHYTKCLTLVRDNMKKAYECKNNDSDETDDKEQKEIEILKRRIIILQKIIWSSRDTIRLKENKALRQLCEFHTNDFTVKTRNEELRKKIIKMFQLQTTKLDLNLSKEINKLWSTVINGKLHYRRLQQRFIRNEFQTEPIIIKLLIEINYLDSIVHNVTFSESRETLKKQNDKINELRIKISKKIADSKITNDNLENTKHSITSNQSTDRFIAKLQCLEQAIKKNEKEIMKKDKIIKNNQQLIIYYEKYRKELSFEVSMCNEEIKESYQKLISFHLKNRKNLIKSLKHNFDTEKQCKEAEILFKELENTTINLQLKRVTRNIKKETLIRFRTILLYYCECYMFSLKSNILKTENCNTDIS